MVARTRLNVIACLVSHLRSKNAASVHGSSHPHYSLSHCYWGPDRMSIQFVLFLPCAVHVFNDVRKWRFIYLFIYLFISVKIYIKKLWEEPVKITFLLVSVYVVTAD